MRSVFFPAVFYSLFLHLSTLSHHLCLQYAAVVVDKPNECNFVSCVHGHGSRVHNISDKAGASPRQSLSTYLAPTENVTTIVLVEQCYVACFDRFLQESYNRTGPQYYFPNAANLPCMGNMKVFLCIATCLFHINPHLPGYTSDFTVDSYKDVYDPQKEIQFQVHLLQKHQKVVKIALAKLRFFQLNSTEYMSKLEEELEVQRKLDLLNGSIPTSLDCSNFCNVSEYGICATAFEGNVQNDKCKTTCSVELCSQMCNVGKNISESILLSLGKLSPPESPVGPPHIYHKQDPERQKEFPAVYYDISSAISPSQQGPLAVVWAVEYNAREEYYAQTFRHPHVTAEDYLQFRDVYRLYTHYNHSGSHGYLSITEFCHAANVSFAIISKTGVSQFSEASKVCFPGDYYPSPPHNMSLSAGYYNGVLILNISLDRSADHDSIESYNLMISYSENQSNTKCADAATEHKITNLRFNANDSLVMTLAGTDDFHKYNFSILWNCTLAFTMTVLPRPPPDQKPKETVLSYYLNEPELSSPQIKYSKEYSFHEITGSLNLTVKEYLITASWNSSADTFVNCSTVSISSKDTTVSYHMDPGDPVTFSDLNPLMEDNYVLMVKRCCCIMANTRYKYLFDDYLESLDMLPRPSPTKLSNLSVNIEDVKNGFVDASLLWTSSAHPYGISMFKLTVFHSTSSIVKDVTFSVNETVQPLQEFVHKIQFSSGQGGLFNLSVYAYSTWGTRSESINSTIRIGKPTQEPISIPSYVWGIVVVVVFFIIVLFFVVIGVYIWYYRKNTVVVIPQSAAQMFVENAVFEDNEDMQQEFFPLSLMDAWEIKPQDIIVLGQLGEGNFGEVFRGLLKSGIDTPSGVHEEVTHRGIVVAVKLLKSDATAALKCEFFKEIDMMKKISSGSCPYIVNMIGCSTHEEPIALVLEYAPNGDLLKYLRTMRKLSADADNDEQGTNENHYVNGPKGVEDLKEDAESDEVQVSTKADNSWGDYRKLGDLTPANLISFGWQIASGMEYLSELNIVHRDLASRNILVGDNKQLKISDFGLAREDECYVKTTEGKLPLRWMAIESIQERMFTSKSDVWSFGVVLWEIATMGGHPYPTLGNRAILAYLLRGMRLERPKNCSEQWYQLMMLCWAKNSEDRPHFTELRVKLEEMLNNAHHDHYIDLTVDEDMPYYRMQPADVDADDTNEVIESFVVDEKSHTGYPEPSDFMESSSAQHMEIILNTRQPSESSVTSAMQLNEEEM